VVTVQFLLIVKSGEHKPRQNLDTVECEPLETLVQATILVFAEFMKIRVWAIRINFFAKIVIMDKSKSAA